MSPKQEVYRDMLHWALPHLRNLSCGTWWQKTRDKSAYFDSELVHNLPVSLYEQGFVDHDIWFLNIQGRWYHDECNSRISPIYDRQIENLRMLFELVPPEMRSKLEWTGPEENA